MLIIQANNEELQLPLLMQTPTTEDCRTKGTTPKTSAIKQTCAITKVPNSTNTKFMYNKGKESKEPLQLLKIWYEKTNAPQKYIEHPMKYKQVLLQTCLKESYQIMIIVRKQWLDVCQILRKKIPLVCSVLALDSWTYCSGKQAQEPNICRIAKSSLYS